MFLREVGLLKSISDFRLNFASIARAPKGVVKVLAERADPVLLPVVERVGTSMPVAFDHLNNQSFKSREYLPRMQSCRSRSAFSSWMFWMYQKNLSSFPFLIYFQAFCILFKITYSESRPRCRSRLPSYSTDSGIMNTKLHGYEELCTFYAPCTSISSRQIRPWLFTQSKTFLLVPQKLSCTQQCQRKTPSFIDFSNYSFDTKIYQRPSTSVALGFLVVILTESLKKG